jgi:hypothetical protein
MLTVRLAEFERDLIRTGEGRERAKAKARCQARLQTQVD